MEAEAVDMAAEAVDVAEAVCAAYAVYGTETVEVGEVNMKWLGRERMKTNRSEKCVAIRCWMR